MYESIPKKIWRVIYPAFLLLAAYVAVYFVAILTYTTFFIEKYPTLEHFMGAAGDIVSIIALTVGGLAAWLFYKNDYVIISKDILKKPVYFVLIAVCGMLFGHGLSILVSLLNVSGIFGRYTQTAAMLSASGVLITAVKTVILAPIAEELAFRGLVFKRTQTYLSFWPAAVISSLFFAIYHLNLVQGIYAFIYGILLCMVYRIFNNIAATMVMHAAANLFSICFQLLKLDYPSIPAYIVAMVIVLAAGTALYMFVLKKWNHK